MYQRIQQAGNRGIWSRDIRLATNLPAQKVQRALKTLEGRNAVKLVKGTSGGNKKIYMLAELSPSDELTGGQWCAANP